MNTIRHYYISSFVYSIFIIIINRLIIIKYKYLYINKALINNFSEFKLDTRMLICKTYRNIILN